QVDMDTHRVAVRTCIVERRIVGLGEKADDGEARQVWPFRAAPRVPEAWHQRRRRRRRDLLVGRQVRLRKCRAGRCRDKQKRKTGAQYAGPAAQPSLGTPPECGRHSYPSPESAAANIPSKSRRTSPPGLMRRKSGGEMFLDLMNRQLDQILVELGAQHPAQLMRIGLTQDAQCTRRRDDDEVADLAVAHGMVEPARELLQKNLLRLAMPIGLLDGAAHAAHGSELAPGRVGTLRAG